MLIVHFLSAKPQLYLGASIGGEMLYRKLKALSHQKKDKASREINDFELEWGNEDGLITYKCDAKKWLRPTVVTSLKLGGNFPFGKNWHGMIEANFGLLNVNAVLGQLKGLIRHNIGIFFGAGVELTHTWMLTHPIQKQQETLDPSRETVFKHQFIDYSVLGEVDETLDVFKPAHKTLISPLVSLGWHIPVSKRIGIQIEAQALITPGFQTPYYAMDVGGAEAPDNSWSVQLSYGTHVKLRLLASIITFI